MKNKCAITILFLLLINLASANMERFVSRIPHPTPDMVMSLKNQALDIASYKPSEYIDLVLTRQQHACLESVYPEIFVVQTESDLKRNLSSTHRDIPGYRSYSQVLQLLSSLQTQYPDLIRIVTLGDSWGKTYAQSGISSYDDFEHEIIAVMLSDNADVDEDEPAFYFTGAHHAREPIGTEVCLETLTHLLNGYGNNPRITHIVDTSEIWFVPIINPDGHKIVLDQTDVWWRKNIRDNNNNSSFDFDEYGYGIDGVDLNRNYGYKWGYTSATDSYSYPTYHGPEGFSEPEINAFKHLVEERHFLGGINYHSYGEMVLYPYGYISELYAPDHLEMGALAVQMANTIPGIGQAFYNPMPSWSLYPASGTTDDWAYANFGIFSYTIELATQFIPTATQVTAITQNNLESAKLLVERKDRAILQGHITDAITSLPLVATIYIEGGLDDSPLYRAPYKSNSSFGAYYRFLPTGEYTVHYHAEGYLSQTREVTILDDAVTIEEIALYPSSNIDLAIHIMDDNGFAVSGAKISFPDSNIEEQFSDQSGVALFSSFPAGSYPIRIEKEDFQTLQGFRHFLTPNVIFTLMSSPMLYDGFENGIANWTTSGSWGLTSSQSVAGSYSLSDSPTGNYTNNGTSFCQYAFPISLEGILSANLEFQIKHNIRQDGDYLCLQLSTDGLAWQSLDNFDGTSNWVLRSYNLNSYIGSSIWLRFLLLTNNSSSSDGVYIDEFKIYMSSTTSDTDHPPLVLPIVHCYPNPFGESLNIELSTLAKYETYSIDLYNVRGQHISKVAGFKAASINQLIQLNTQEDQYSSLPTGIYFLRVNGGGNTIATKKLLHIK